MSPECSGPAAGSPVGITNVQPVSPEVAASIFAAGRDLWGQLAAKVASAIQQGLDAGLATWTDLATKVATPLAAGLASGQATLDSLAATAKGGIAAFSASTAAPPGGGGTSEQGVKPGQYTYNLFQYKLDPYPTQWGPATSVQGGDPAEWCFRGSWTEPQDVAAFSDQIKGHRPPDFCYSPGAPATGSPPPVDSHGCPGGEWQVYLLSAGGQVIGCTARCTTDPPPPNSTAVGGPITYDQALVVLNNPVCNPTPTPPGPPGSGFIPWYVLCDLQNNLNVAQTQSVQGEKVYAGPFQTQAEAQAALAAAPAGFCGVQPPINPPPAPTPGGECICLPDCIHIDLCDWKKFEDSLYNALCRWYHECMCKLDNTTAYQLSDCDGVLTTDLDAWYGNGVGNVAIARTLADAAKSAAGGLPASSASPPGNSGRGGRP